jgi:hypothetical protein
MDEKARKKIDEFQDFLATKAQFISNSSIYDDDDYDSAHGGFGPNYDGTTVLGDPTTRGTVAIKGADSSVKRKIASCREAYMNEGIIGNIIDLMIDFSVEEIEITHESKQVENFYKRWADTVNLFNLAEETFKSYYRDGNTPILSFNAKIEQDTEKRLRRAIGNEFLIPTPVEPKVIPIKYSVLDILRFEKEGTGFVGVERYWYTIGTEDLRILKSPKTELEREVAQKAKKMFQGAFEEMVKAGRIPLEPNRVKILYYKKDGFSKWAIPMLWRIIKDVKYKELLRRMDISVAEGVLNALTIIKLGSMKDELPPSPEAYTKLVGMVKNPAKSKIIIWDDLIDVQSVFPPVENMLGVEKYEQVNKDISRGIGIPGILVGGEQAGGFSNAFLSVRTVMERLKGGRKGFLDLLKNEVRIIAKNMGFRKPPSVKIKGIGLTDQQMERKLLLELVDRNIISYRTVADKFGEDIDIEINRMREEDNLRKDIQETTPFAVLKTGKFGPQHNNGVIPLLTLDENQIITGVPNGNESPTGQEEEGNKGGKPEGKTGKQENPALKPKKPQGQETTKTEAKKITINQELYKKADDMFEKAFNIISAEVLKSRGYNSLSAITNSELKKIYNGVTKAILRINKIEDITKENILKVLSKKYKLATAPAKLDRCVADIKKRRIASFRKKNKRSPNKKETQDITSSAFAICTEALKKKG